MKPIHKPIEVLPEDYKLASGAFNTTGRDPIIAKPGEENRIVLMGHYHCQGKNGATALSMMVSLHGFNGSGHTFEVLGPGHGVSMFIPAIMLPANTPFELERTGGAMPIIYTFGYVIRSIRVY
ncbi:MAG: hypothetical protein AAGF24_00080 [Cyanobacteria bacterium P01_H01_bin.121]